MKEQLKKMFGESLPSIDKCTIKTEDTFHSHHHTYENEETDCNYKVS